MIAPFDITFLRAERSRLSTCVGDYSAFRKENTGEWARFFKEEQRDAEHRIKAINLVLSRLEGEPGPMRRFGSMAPMVAHYAGLA